jgi:hypothetical protein
MRSNLPADLCRDIGMVQLAGRLEAEGAVLSFCLLVCGTDVAWQHRNIVSTNPRDVQMPRKTCMAAGPALICSNQGTVDDVRYLILACPEETPQTKEVQSSRLDARERGSITRRRSQVCSSRTGQRRSPAAEHRALILEEEPQVFPARLQCQQAVVRAAFSHIISPLSSLEARDAMLFVGGYDTNLAK